MASLVTFEAPDFTAQAVMPDNSIKDLTLSSYRSKYVVLFFYPLDFTFVCPSEIIAFDKVLSEFKKRNAEVIGASIDSQFTHLAWKKTPREKGGIGQINFPLVADLNKNISRDYGILFNDSIALRGLFSNRPDLIDGFVAGKQGQQNVAHEVLRPVLEDTYGLLIYQEQLMEVAHRVAGFSYTQADLLRRALGKEEDVWRGRFVGGCESNGLTEEVGVLCYAVLRDSGHLVNRSHWVAYGVLSYWVGYLKVHYAELFDGVVKGLEDNGGL